MADRIPRPVAAPDADPVPVRRSALPRAGGNHRERKRRGWGPLKAAILPRIPPPLGV